MSDIRQFTEQNRRAWNEIAEIRAASRKPARFFAEGGSTLVPEELAAVEDVKGKTLLHLQCATGEDTLSWVVAGAIVTGVDISEAQIALAQQKAREAGLPARFLASDVYTLPTELQQGTFDYVYTGGGAIVWLPELTRWGQVIAAALKPGGRVLIYDEHPVAQCLWVSDGELHIDGDYFRRERPGYCEPGWGHFDDQGKATEPKAEFSWPLGDIVTALAQAGLRIESLQEFPSRAEWRFKELLSVMRRLPGQFLLVASKDAH